MTGKGKRGVKSIPIFLDSQLWENLHNDVNAKSWNYKIEKKDLFILRDKALICLIILTGLRIGECLKLQKKQFRSYKTYIQIANVVTLKNGNIREKIVLPRYGKLREFSEVVRLWLDQLPNEDSYFVPRGSLNGNFYFNAPLTPRRSWEIVKTQTSKFPHWYRGVCANIHGHLIFKNDAWKLKEFMGWKRLDSSSPYVTGVWEEDIKNYQKL